MRRLTMLVALVAALVMASSTTGALLAQNTHKHSTTQQGTTPNTQQSVTPNTPQGTTPNNKQSQLQSIGTPEQLGEKAVSTGKGQSATQAASSSTVYGPYSFDISDQKDNTWGGHNDLYTYGYLVPAGTLSTTTTVAFCQYDTSTGKNAVCYYVPNSPVKQWADPNNDSSFSMFSYDTPFGLVDAFGSGARGWWDLNLYDPNAGLYISTSTGPHFVYVY